MPKSCSKNVRSKFRDGFSILDRSDADCESRGHCFAQDRERLLEEEKRADYRESALVTKHHITERKRALAPAAVVHLVYQALVSLFWKIKAAVVPQRQQPEKRLCVETASRCDTFLVLWLAQEYLWKLFV